MLPPVRATSSSFVELQAPGQQPVLRQRIDIANGGSGTGATVSPPISGGRLDLASLSAQLRLAQGFSIFAETIGRLIKLPRRDGEALVDYARRVLDAVKTMTPAQQAALEKALNQLVKGVSLQLLTQILGNPAGPDAARLALRLEAGQFLERDAAAKAVVSSYRQNAAAEAMPATQPAAKQSPQARPAAVSQQASSPAGAQQPTSAQLSADMAAGAQASSAALQASLPDVVTETSAAGPTTRTDMPAQAQAEAGSVAGNANPARMPVATKEATQQAFAQPPGPAADGAKAGIAASTESPKTTSPMAVAQEIAPAEVLPLAADTGQSEAAGAAGRGEKPVSASSPPARQTAALVLYDGPALARLSERGLDQHAGSSATRPATVAALTEWLAEVFADGETGPFEPLPAAAEPLPEQQALEELLSRENLIPNRSQAAETGFRMPQERTSQPEEGPQGLLPDARLAEKPGAPASQPPHAGDLAQQLALPLMLPQAMRDGVPLPFAYPPEERERDPEERKAKPVTETDEDGGEQQSAGDQAFRDERREGEPQDGEARDDEAQKGAESTEDEGRPNDFYWRMAGWA